MEHDAAVWQLLGSTGRNGKLGGTDVRDWQPLTGAVDLSWCEQCRWECELCGPQGGPLAPGWLYKLHQRVCALAGLQGNRVHDLRHNYATIQLYEYHAPIQYVSEQLGHASITITVDIYGHPRQGTSMALADQLDAPMEQARQSATSTQLTRQSSG
jgi:integrase